MSVLSIHWKELLAKLQNYTHQTQVSTQILQKKAMQKDAEENAHAWANVAMISCVADLHESKAKCATNKH